MINEKELEETKEKICKLATKPKEMEWLRRKTGASQDLFEEALDDLTDSRHVKEDGGKVTALKQYKKSKVTVNYCPKCGSRIVGDECPMCRAKVTGVEQHTLGGTIIKVVVVTFLLVAFLGVVSTPGMRKTSPMVVREDVGMRSSVLKEAKYVEVETYLEEVYEQESTIFTYTKFMGDYCEENGMPIVYHFGLGQSETENVLQSLVQDFPVSAHIWYDVQTQSVPQEDGKVLASIGTYPSTVFGCKYAVIDEIRWDQEAQAAAILCDITGHGSYRCQEPEVKRYIELLYSRVGG